MNTIIQNSKGKYLLQMRDGAKGICNPLKWNFFGGGLKGSDVILDAMRELREELGVSVGVENVELVGNVVNESGDKVYVVRCKKKINWNDISIQEGAGGGFFTKDEVLKIDTTSATKQIAKKYL